MEGTAWIAQHWFDLFQTVGIVGSLLFTAYTLWKDERARKIGNSIAINDQYRQTWRELYEHPELARVLAKEVDLETAPVSDDERLFVTMLIVHLSTVHRAMQFGEFVKLEGLKMDVREFFSLPIPTVVWEKISPLQDADFVKFIEVCLRGN